MKLFSTANHYILSARRYDKSGNNTEFLLYDFRGTLSEASKFMADVVLREVGDGDGENGGKGSLSNCYGDIYNSFNERGDYSYADCVFSMLPVFSDGTDDIDPSVDCFDWEPLDAEVDDDGEIPKSCDNCINRNPETGKCRFAS